MLQRFTASLSRFWILKQGSCRDLTWRHGREYEKYVLSNPLISFHGDSRSTQFSSQISFYTITKSRGLYMKFWRSCLFLLKSAHSRPDSVSPSDYLWLGAYMLNTIHFFACKFTYNLVFYFLCRFLFKCQRLSTPSLDASKWQFHMMLRGRRRSEKNSELYISILNAAKYQVQTLPDPLCCSLLANQIPIPTSCSHGFVSGDIHFVAWFIQSFEL